MTKLFKQDYETFNKPEIFFIFKDYGVGHISTHYIYGYRKWKNRWYIKVKNLVDGLGFKKAKARYKWQLIEPKHIDKDKNWLIKMAINHKIAKFDKAIGKLEQRLSSIPEDIEELKEMKLLVSKEQYNWNLGGTMVSNFNDGIDSLRVSDKVEKYYSTYGTFRI